VELLEIEKELKGPEKGRALKRYDAILLGLGARLREAQRVGMAPAEYERCEPLAEAVVIARKLLRLQARG